MDNIASLQLNTASINSAYSNQTDNLTLSDAVQIYNTASQNQSNVKSLGSTVLRDVGRFIESLSSQNRIDANRGADKSESIFSSTLPGNLSSGKTATPSGTLDVQLEKLRQTSDYAGFMSASVSLVSSAVSSIKQLQQG
jgi:hypothetical protein